MTMDFDFKNAGSNISINHHKDCAKRVSQFNDAVVATSHSVKPGQLFSIRVNENDKNWDGNLRIGFSILPDGILFPLPSYSIPDLVDRGGTWMWAIDNDIELEKSTQHDVRSSFTFDRYQNIDKCNMDWNESDNRNDACQCCLTTSYGAIPLYQLRSECLNDSGGRCARLRPGSVGTMISIYYDVRNVEGCEFNEQCNVLEAPEEGSHTTRSSQDCVADAEMNVVKLCFKYTFHILVNGHAVNVCEDLVVIKWPRSAAPDISRPYNYLPEMRAIVDVYGATKSIQIATFEQNQVKSLQDMCVHQMIRRCGYDHINQLPKSLRNYLQIQLHKLIHLSQ